MGIASTLALSAPMLIAADWFPIHERTTAFGEFSVLYIQYRKVFSDIKETINFVYPAKGVESNTSFLYVNQACNGFFLPHTV